MKKIIIGLLVLSIVVLGGCGEKTEEEKCIASEGKWQREGLVGTFMCIYTYSDGREPCQNSEECEGDCIVTSTKEEAFCKETTSPFGCFNTIEEFRNDGGIICRD